MYTIVKKIGFLLGPLLFLIIYNLPFELLSPAADKVIAAAAWMVVWWVTECVSISVTALIPLTIFPLLGIMDMKSVAASYGSPIVFLFFGGFVLALALEKVQLHKRIALTIIRITGTSPDKVVLGFMITAALLSMWISNTATTVVMLPIAVSVVDLLINDEDGFTAGDKNFMLSLFLGIAYAANVGGVATIIGTPPNTVMVGFVESRYDIEISFFQWMQVGLPFSLLMIAVVYFVLVKFVYPSGLTSLGAAQDLIKNEHKALGPMSGLEKYVSVIFACAILFWVLRQQLNQWIPFIDLTDAGISMLAAFALFTVPFKFNRGKFILNWEDTRKLPWGILILFGGGLALAGALADVGIIDFIGEQVAQNNNWSIALIGVLLISIMLFMTELMSNVALVSVFAPVIAGIALGLEYEMLYFLIPITMAASCAFMLPMATPPNAIVFASGKIKVSEMVRAGVVLNIVSIVVISLFMMFVIPRVF